MAMIYYGTRRKLKVDKSLGVKICPNCGHQTEQSLAHEACSFTIYFIPVFFYSGWRIKLCPNCGVVEKLTKAQFKEIKAQ